jgi:hypothetical protein
MQLMKKILLILFTLYALPLFAKELTKSEIINKPIKYVYRIAFESLNKCNEPTFANYAQYTSSYFDDNDTALITQISQFGNGDAYKLKKIDGTHTEISYYKETCLVCTLARAEAKLEKTIKWVNDGEADCNLVDTAPTQNIIK